MGLLSFIHDILYEGEYQPPEKEIERMNAINYKINILPLYGIEEFKDQLFHVIETKGWLVKHGMNKVNPDIQEVKEILYEEKFKQYVCLN